MTVQDLIKELLKHPLEERVYLWGLQGMGAQLATENDVIWEEEG